MWDRLRKQVTIERQQLHRLLEPYRHLIAKCVTTPPSAIELSALATMLHSFYTGVENIFKCTISELGGSVPTGEASHKDLLDVMAQTIGRRNAVISPGLQIRLKEYLEFRHVFRHAYTFDLRWDKMRGLVLGCEETLGRLEGEVDRFLESEGKRDQ